MTFHDAKIGYIYSSHSRLSQHSLFSIGTVNMLLAMSILMHISTTFLNGLKEDSLLQKMVLKSLIFQSKNEKNYVTEGSWLAGE